MRPGRLATLLPCLLAFAFAFAGCGGDGDAGSSPREDFVGLVSEDVFAGDAAYREANLEKQAGAGVGLIRQTFDWAKIETVEGTYDFGAYDLWMEALAAKNMKALPILFGAPPFRSSAPAAGANEGTYPPRDPAAFGEFAAAATRRYGPNGTFWSAKPDLPYLPVTAWQVWNEPSLPAYWPAGPDAAAYTQLLRAAFKAIKRIDPNAEVVSAGIPNSKLGVPFERYVEGLLDAGAAEAFDTLGIHPYATDVEGVFAAVRRARAALKRHGSKEKIWITEIGWATAGPQSPFTVGSQGQASRIAQLFEELPVQREKLGIRGLVYFNWKDSQPFEGGSDFFGLHTGLLDVNGAEKPGFLAFQRGAEALGG
jgi:polysaccharide biosynthesis protein PslG